MLTIAGGIFLFFGIIIGAVIAILAVGLIISAFSHGALYLIDHGELFVVPILVIGLIFAVIFWSAENHAEPYLGLGYTKINGEETATTGLKISTDLTAVYLKAGYNFTNHLGIEYRYGTGHQDDEFGIFGVTIDIEVKRIQSLLLTARTDDTKPVFIYALAGKSHGKLKLSRGNFNDTLSGTYTSGGVGITFNIDPDLSISLEHSYMKGSDTEYKGLDLSVTRRF